MGARVGTGRTNQADARAQCMSQLGWVTQGPAIFSMTRETKEKLPMNMDNETAQPSTMNTAGANQALPQIDLSKIDMKHQQTQSSNQSSPILTKAWACNLT
ncbi:27450_t:CDS:2 [Gigaspora margarita]|uniref:27450_t:CDS:1 n=1 Tax=Gigaspora margarita TaxID=4874 RepID=A0ABM8W3R1_GIGMA|nr:27450_t:CDS:2 [Gigaspora margarita]